MDMEEMSMDDIAAAHALLRCCAIARSRYLQRNTPRKRKRRRGGAMRNWRARHD